VVVETGEGLPTATSYCSLVFANAYHLKNKRTAATWAALSDTQKEYRLEHATELIDRECYFAGYPAHTIPTEQGLQWPRYDAVDRNRVDVLSTTIPEDLQRATADLAVRLEQKDLDKEPTRGILSVGAGQNAVAVTFDPYREPSVLVRSVMNFLRPFLVMGGGSAFGRAVR
jgi:hypothetical protein